jgi:hypothetical protein
MAAEEFGATAFGIEADLLRVLWSRFAIRRRGLKDKVTVIWGNLFHYSLEEATIVSIYQLQSVNQKLKSKFTEELKPGTRLISHAFTFEEWTPIDVSSKPDLYLYSMPTISEMD